MVLESVLSTDGVEPLYFITSDDLTYQGELQFSVPKTWLSGEKMSLKMIKCKCVSKCKQLNCVNNFHF